MSSVAAGGSVTPLPQPRATPSLRLGVEQEGTTLYLTLAGSFGWRSVGRVEAALERASASTRVVVDLRRLSVLDIAGLRTLLRANERAHTEAFDMFVVRPRGLVNRIFTLTRAGTELTMVDCAPGRDAEGPPGREPPLL